MWPFCTFHGFEPTCKENGGWRCHSNGWGNDQEVIVIVLSNRGMGGLCLEPSGFSKLPFNIFMLNSKSYWKTTPKQNRHIHKQNIEDLNSLGIKFWITLPGKEL